MVALGLGLGVAMRAGTADACTAPSDPTLLGPSLDGPVPANAALRFGGFDLDPEQFVATVDGEPAEITEITELHRMSYAFEERALLVEGVTEGQHVVMSWCGFGDCLPIAEYDAVAPHLEAPAPPTSLLFDLHDYPGNHGFGPACQDSEGLRWWIKTEVPASFADIETFVVFEGVAVNDGESLRFRDYSPFDGTPLDFPVARVDTVLDGDDPPSAVCIRGYVLDTAGNRSAELETCLPCRYGTDEAALDGSMLPLQPMWDQGDIYPDGSCAVGVPEPWDPGPPPDEGTTGSGDETGGDSGDGDNPSTGGVGEGTTRTSLSSDSGESTGDSAGQDSVPRGCACRLSPRPGSGWWRGGLVLLVGIGLRRRSRDAHRSARFH